MHRNLCTGDKRNEASNFGAGLGGPDSREDDGAAKIDLTYSTLSDINRARRAFGLLGVCISQVIWTRPRYYSIII